MEEIWKDIEGYEGYYQVSNLGNVKRLKHTTVYKDNRVYTYDEKILTQGLCKNGYYIVSLGKNGKKKSFNVHYLVAKAFVENTDPENKTQVSHLDETMTNNKANNLEWATPKENMNMPLHRFRDSNSLKNNKCALGKHNISKENREKMRTNCKKVFCDKKIFNSMTECAEYYRINVDTLYSYLSRKELPKIWIERNLHYIYSDNSERYGSEIDED